MEIANVRKKGRNKGRWNENLKGRKEGEKIK
jgi:hypothetical protein